MRITLCGSMRFAAEFKKIKESLEKMGHYVSIPQKTEQCIGNPLLNEDIEFCIKKDVIRNHHQKIRDSNAILVLNFDKDGVKNYVGASAFMEMGFAHVLNKKIFLLQDIPDKSDLRYSDEIQMMQPVVLNGDLSKIAEEKVQGRGQRTEDLNRLRGNV